MKASLALAALSALAITEACAQNLPCGGPFAQCAYSVGAYCTRDADGGQRIHFWDYPGNSMTFERCVSSVFRANGQPDPYTTGSASGGRVSLPRFELHYPHTRENVR